MNTKFVAACIVGSFIAAATMMAQAQNYDTVAPRNCIGDGVLPPVPIWDTEDHHPGLGWCCWAKYSGLMQTGEDVRYYSNGTVRTNVSPEPPCTQVVPP